jgi:ABC-type antimicrobial peptide transport system permease subunit
LIDKYGDEASLANIHHYETIEVKNTSGATIVPAGLHVPSDYSVSYFDYQTDTQVSTANITVAVTNQDYEDRIQDAKRNIFLLKPEYINIILNDMKEIMRYKKGGTQYVSPTLKRADNIRLFQ